MIRVQIDVEGMRFRMEGHADFGPVGSDIVCAGATMLASTLISHVTRICDPYDVLECALESGLAVLEVSPMRKRKRKECRIVFAAIHEGFELLVQRYPHHVKID